MSENILPAEFFEALGAPRPEVAFDVFDAYRFKLCFNQLGPGSVLDVGSYLGDFLKLIQRDGRKFHGTEINQVRVDLVNSIFGEGTAVLDFRNGHLDSFETGSIDNVVCMETIEHVIDDKYAISELCRVARSKVIITVPFREKLQTVLCTHCFQYTPLYGHRHRYDYGSFKALIPPGWTITMEKDFVRPAARKVHPLLNWMKSAYWILKGLDAISPGSGHWILVVLERKRKRDGGLTSPGTTPMFDGQE